MGLRDHLHHHDKAGAETAQHPNNLHHVGGVGAVPVQMPGAAAGYTKPVYVPVESLPKGTVIPNNHEGHDGKHHFHLPGHKHTVPAGAAAAPAQTTENAPTGVPVPRHDGKHGSHDDLVPKTGVVGITDAANPVLIPGLHPAAPVPVPVQPAPVPVPAPAPVQPAPVPVEPVPAPVPVARDVADLPPAGEAHHSVPLTTTGPVNEIHPEPVRDIDQVPVNVPAGQDVPRSAAIPETGAPAVIPPTEPMAAPVESTREVAAPVKDEPTIIQAAPTGGPRPQGTHHATTGIKPAGTTVPSMVHDVASGSGPVNEHAVSTHQQPSNPDIHAV